MGVRKTAESPYSHNEQRHAVGESSDCQARIGRVALAVIITLASFVFLPPPLAIAVGIISFTVALISSDCSSSTMSRYLASSSFGCRGPSTNLGQPRQRPNHFYTDETSLPRDNEASRHYAGSPYPSLSPIGSTFGTSPPPQRHETSQQYVGTSSSSVPSSLSAEIGSRTSPPPQRDETDQPPFESFSSLNSSFTPPSVSGEKGSRTEPKPQQHKAPNRFDASSNSSIGPFASPFPLMQKESTANPAPFSSLPSSFNQGGGESPPTVSAEVGSRTGPPPKEGASGATGGRNRKKVGND